MKTLPIGIQSFEKLRTGKSLYVDKTKEIYQLITSGNVFFLSRPRRFGKSLLVSTLGEIFKGNKALFEGLYIYDKIDWMPYPVIRLDFGERSSRTLEQLQSSLHSFLNDVAEQYSVTLIHPDLAVRFSELIRRLHEASGQKVVILIDEYDKPITDHLLESEILTENKTVLHDFYQVLKAADDHIQFIFLTGVSKFAGVSVFSALNNLNDITLDEKFASICGISQIELESYFSEYIDDVAEHVSMNREDLIAEIRRWYNGYSWDGKTLVYNPFSTLLFFYHREFGSYWFNTGTPSFLIDILKKDNHLEHVLEPITVSKKVFNSYDPLHINDIPLLFQTGYLTIKKKELIYGQPQYTIGIPNEEVNESLLECLLYSYTNYPIESAEGLRNRMRAQLLAHDTSALDQCLREMISWIPYMLIVKSEAYYHSIMLIWLRLLGFNLIDEVPTNIGRMDAVWHFPGHTIVVEVKSQPEKGNIPKLLDIALAQIREKRYYERFMSETKVSLLGVAFADNEIGCRIEEV